MTDSGPDMDQIKAAMRATWMAGDFGEVARTVGAKAGEPFAERIALPPGSRVLDVACGTGNVTIPLARRGSTVTGVDIAPNLLVQARERAMAEGLAIRFEEGDAEQLPYPEAAFDAVTTMFGAMFAPRPAVVAAEMARVLRPGGLLAMGNWTPAGFTGRMFRVGAHHAPAPGGLAPPVLWGDAAIARERLGREFVEIRTEAVSLEFDLPMSPAAVVEFFRRYFGPSQMAFDRLDEGGRARLRAELEALWTEANVAPDPEAHTVVKNEYLLVLATRR